MSAKKQDSAKAPLLSRLSPPVGAVSKRLRVGRGVGSGLGKTAGRGTKGQKARTTMHKNYFQGGQMPLQRRLPKVGFKNPNPTRWVIINVSDLSRFAAGSVVDEAKLREVGLIKGAFDAIKLLANGELDRGLTLRVHAASEAAAQKVAKAGGKLDLIPAPKKPEEQ